MTQPKQVAARGILILSVTLLCIAADQLSKQWATASLVVGNSRSFVPGILNFTLTSNPGAAFSLGSEHGQVMGIVATILTLAILAWIIKSISSSAPPRAVEQIGMGCLLGGAIGNLLDRYNQGRVTDFLEFAFISFPVFNVADSLIDVGIGLLLISIVCSSRDSQKTASPESSVDDTVNAGQASSNH